MHLRTKPHGGQVPLLVRITVKEEVLGQIVYLDSCSRSYQAGRISKSGCTMTLAVACINIASTMTRAQREAPCIPSNRHQYAVVSQQVHSYMIHSTINVDEMATVSSLCQVIQGFKMKFLLLQVMLAEAVLSPPRGPTPFF